MSKFKKIGLDYLLAHGINTENTLIVETIDKFIEDTVLHLLYVRDSEDFNLMNDLEMNKEFDGGIWKSIVRFDDWTSALIEGADMFFAANFEVYGHYEADGDFDYVEVNFTKLNLNWMDNSFNMIGTLVEEVLTDEIIDLI